MAQHSTDPSELPPDSINKKTSLFSEKQGTSTSGLEPCSSSSSSPSSSGNNIATTAEITKISLPLGITAADVVTATSAPTLVPGHCPCHISAAMAAPSVAPPHQHYISSMPRSGTSSPSDMGARVENIPLLSLLPTSDIDSLLPNPTLRQEIDSFLLNPNPSTSPMVDSPLANPNLRQDVGPPLPTLKLRQEVDSPLPNSRQEVASLYPNPSLSPPGPTIHSTPSLSREEEQSGKKGRGTKRSCGACRRSVGLVGFKCKCGGIFCGVHRYSDRHECTYDYKAAGREAIAKQNPLVQAMKIVKI